MKSSKRVVSTNTFKLAVPTIFREEKIQHEGLSVWHLDTPYKLQFPIINAALGEIKDITEEFPSDSYEQSVHAYYQIKRFNIIRIENETIEVQGKTAYVQRAFSRVDENTRSNKSDQPIDIFHLFVNIPLDGEFIQEFSADCELPERDQYEPLFWEAVHSVEWLGDFRKHVDAQEEAMAATYARIDALLNKTKETSQQPYSNEPESPDVPAFEIPADGQDVFRIGDFDFNIEHDQCAWSIPEFSKRLVITLKAHIDAVKAATKARLLDDYRTDGQVSLSFEANKLYRHGQPFGSFTLADDKSVGHGPNLYLRAEGFDYRLHFFGDITFEGEWMGIRGHLRVPYENTSGFPVTVYKRMRLDQLDWANYQFSSLEEARQAPDEVVRYLVITNPTFKTLPEEILRYRNLVQLSITSHQSLALSELPEAIGKLKQLQHLSIGSASLSRLPASLGKLRRLKYLGVSGNALTEIPASVWYLPQLQSLYLRDNQLRKIPAQIDLPELVTLDVSGNALTTLPTALTRQPKLRTLTLNDNPWESLPAGISAIKGIRLSIEDKRRLLDFEYRGADGQGTIRWDNEIFLARSDEPLLASMESVIQKSELGDYRDALISLAKKAVGFTHTEEEDYTALGNHRFGGMPDLPSSIPYPRFYREYDKKEYMYEFIAQINCTEVAALQGYLPREGVLYFFLTTFHDIYDRESSPLMVIHYDGSEPLESGKRWRFEGEDYVEMMDGGYTGFKVSTRTINSIPDFYSIGSNEYLLQGPAEVLKDEALMDSDQLRDFEDRVREQNKADHKINAYGFTQHEFPEHEAALVMKGKPEDWIVLLEVSSRGDFQWGDAGELFFVIHKSDLLKKDFSNVFCSMYSS